MFVRKANWYIKWSLNTFHSLFNNIWVYWHDIKILSYFFKFTPINHIVTAWRNVLTFRWIISRHTDVSHVSILLLPAICLCFVAVTIVTTTISLNHHLRAPQSITPIVIHEVRHYRSNQLDGYHPVVLLTVNKWSVKSPSNTSIHMCTTSKVQVSVLPDRHQACI